MGRRGTRRARAVLGANPRGYETLNPSCVAADFQRGVQQLVPTPCCVRCGAGVSRSIQGYACDIDQAFEACATSRVVTSWGGALRRAQAPPRPVVLVRKSRRCITKISENACGHGWWRLTCEHLTMALLASCVMTLVLLGPLPLQLFGCAIGAIMSSSTVGTVLAGEEAESHVSPLSF